MPKSPEQPTSPETKKGNMFLTQLGKIERQVGLLNATRNQLDKDAKLNALEVIKKLETATGDAKRKKLLFELGRQVALFDATKSELDKDAKLEALKLIEGLE